MTREGQKRFCDSCKKHVHDLSAMTPTDAKALLEGETTAGLCVRYLYDERGNVMFRPSGDLVASSALTRMRRFVTAAGVLAVPLSLNACMGSKMMDPVPPRPVMTSVDPAVNAAAPAVDPAADAGVARDATDATDATDACPPGLGCIPTAEMLEPPAPMDDGPPYRAK